MQNGRDERRSLLSHYRWQLSQKATKAELKFKELLDRYGVRYQFQKGFLTRDPITHQERFRIVDFYIKRSCTAIEIDGDYHFTKEGIRRDEYRTLELTNSKEKLVFRRFTNDQVMSEAKIVIYFIKLFKQRQDNKYRGKRRRAGKALNKKGNVKWQPTPGRPELLPSVEYFLKKRSLQ